MVSIYKGVREEAVAKIKETRINDYPNKWTPRFSEGIKKMKDPLKDDVMKVFCVFKR